MAASTVRALKEERVTLLVFDNGNTYVGRAHQNNILGCWVIGDEKDTSPALIPFERIIHFERRTVPCLI